MKIKPFSRLLARTLDYFLFYFSVTVFLKFVGMPLSAFGAIVFTLLLPLFFIPVEALTVSLFGSTLGHRLFGITIQNRKGDKLGFLESLKRAALLGFKIIAPINLLYPILFLAKKSESKFDHEHGIQIVAKGRKRIIGTLLLATCLTGWFFEEQIFETPQTVFSAFGKNTSWFHLRHPDGTFAADFPKNPVFKNEPIPIKGSKPLDYSEYSHKDGDFIYSLSYSKIPSTWLQAGNSLLLKGAIKAIAAHLPHTEVVAKHSIKYQNMPGLNFTLKQPKDREVSGRLLLRDRTLYKLEVSYPKAKKNQVQEKIDSFLNSFTADKDQIQALIEQEAIASAQSLSSVSDTLQDQQ